MVDLSAKELAALKATAHDLPVRLSVGKSGVTDALVQEIKEQLGREPLIKVRLLRSARGEDDKGEMARGLAEATGAVLVELRGFTVVLYRPRGRRAP